MPIIRTKRRLNQATAAKLVEVRLEDESGLRRIGAGREIRHGIHVTAPAVVRRELQLARKRFGAMRGDKVGIVEQLERGMVAASVIRLLQAWYNVESVGYP